MNIKKFLSTVVSAALFVSSFGTVLAAEENTVDITSYIVNADTQELELITGNVFVGETVKTVVGIENMGDYGAYDIGVMYDEAVIQLAPLADITPNKAYNFDLEDVGIEISDYGTTKLLTLNKSYVFPNIGAIVAPRQAADVTNPGTAVVEHTDLFTIEYKAIAPGNSGFRWPECSTDGEDIFFEALDADLDIDIGQGNGYFLDFPPIENINSVVNNFEVIEKPGDPTDVVWATGEGVYTVTWTEPATGCRGYEVIVYVNDQQKGSAVKVTDTEYDLIEEGVIGTLTTGDIVKVSVKALGGEGSNAVESDPKEVTGTPLGEITPVMGDNEVLTWNSVEHAAGYIIEVFDSEGNTVGEAINVPNTETFCDLSDVITVDDYTIKVIADNGNNPLYIDSEKTIAYSTGSTITGTVKAELGNDSLTPNPNHITTVTLKNDSTGEEYSANCDVNGNFAITGVPGDAANGISYSVIIARTSSLTRTNFGRNNDKLVLKNSVEKNICKNGTPLTIYVGDFIVDTHLTIQAADFLDMATMSGAMEGFPGFDVKYDVVSGDGVIDIDDVSVVLSNLLKGARHYSILTDYDFTIAE